MSTRTIDDDIEDEEEEQETFDCEACGVTFEESEWETERCLCERCEEWVCRSCFNPGFSYCDYCMDYLVECPGCKALVRSLDYVCYAGCELEVCEDCYAGDDFCNDCYNTDSTASTEVVVVLHEPAPIGGNNYCHCDAKVKGANKVPITYTCAYCHLIVCSACYYAGAYSCCKHCLPEYSKTNTMPRHPIDRVHVHWHASDKVVCLEPERNFTEWQDHWPIDRTLRPSQAMADFYLLDVIKHNVFSGPILEPALLVISHEAEQRSKRLVELWDKTFCNYADLAIGGELRHHPWAKRSNLFRAGRSDTWVDWAYIRNQLGLEPLYDAIAMFDDVPGSGMGGKRWGDAARLLHDRLSGKITPEQWVDRVFTLQHNGGSFLNKILWGLPEECKDSSHEGDPKYGDRPDWQYDPVEEMTKTIGPAHSALEPDFNVLLKFASPGMYTLWQDYWTVANQNRRIAGLPMMQRSPDPEIRERKTRYLRHGFKYFLDQLYGIGQDASSYVLSADVWEFQSEFPSHPDYQQIFDWLPGPGKLVAVSGYCKAVLILQAARWNAGEPWFTFDNPYQWNVLDNALSDFLKDCTSRVESVSTAKVREWYVAWSNEMLRLYRNGVWDVQSESFPQLNIDSLCPSEELVLAS